MFESRSVQNLRNEEENSNFDNLNHENFKNNRTYVLIGYLEAERLLLLKCLM